MHARWCKCKGKDFRISYFILLVPNKKNSDLEPGTWAADIVFVVVVEAARVETG
jgi:hypothetical protein